MDNAGGGPDPADRGTVIPSAQLLARLAQQLGKLPDRIMIAGHTETDPKPALFYLPQSFMGIVWQ